MNLYFQLRAVGVFEIVLALTHPVFARHFEWRTETSRLSLLNRQIFYVHTFFICVVLTLFGLLNLACTTELLAHSSLAKFVLAGITFFWVLRWLFQFFVYDRRLWKGNRFNTSMHVVFALLWTYFAGIYGLAFWHQFGD